MLILGVGRLGLVIFQDDGDAELVKCAVKARNQVSVME